MNFWPIFFSFGFRLCYENLCLKNMEQKAPQTKQDKNNMEISLISDCVYVFEGVGYLLCF